MGVGQSHVCVYSVCIYINNEHYVNNVCCMYSMCVYICKSFSSGIYINLFAFLLECKYFCAGLQSNFSELNCLRSCF